MVEAEAVNKEMKLAEAEMKWAEASLQAMPVTDKTMDSPESSATGEPPTGLTLPANLCKELVLYYAFDQNENKKVSDKSGRANHGAARGASWVANGKFGGGCMFGDSGQVIQTTRSFKLGDSYSFSVWVHAIPFANDYPCLLYGGKDGMITLHGLGPAYPVGQRQRVGYYSGYNVNNRSYMMIGGELTPNEWTLVVVVVDRGRSSLYLNGHLDASTSNQRPRPIAVLNNLRIGNGSDLSASQQFHGILDEIMVWSRALSTDEVDQLYQRKD